MKNCKYVSPFAFGTTSYILHVKDNNLLTNVRYLKNHFKVIQLLFFGKDYLEELMSPTVLQELAEIKKESSLSYLIHLPLDLNLPATEDLMVIERIIRQTKLLDICQYILHINGDMNSDSFTANDRRLNYIYFKDILKALETRLGDKTSKIAIENTNYDLTLFRKLIKEYGYPVCMDVGHLLYYNHDLDEFIKAFSGRISVIHLHGYKNKKDHRSLKVMERGTLFKILRYADHYHCTLIIEVFNEKNLRDSLKRLAKIGKREVTG
jgi:sugar phosphate isomerase/epimerase